MLRPEARWLEQAARQHALSTVFQGTPHGQCLIYVCPETGAKGSRLWKHVLDGAIPQAHHRIAGCTISPKYSQHPPLSSFRMV